MKPKEPCPPDSGKIYLCAPVNALAEGIYEEKIPFTQIKQHGDFGLGTFDDLDGEMVMLDGQIYRITADGRVHQVDEQALTPFACVTFYSPSSHDELNAELSHAAFLEWLQRLLPSPNVFYAIRAEGRFAAMRVRSVPKQENYRPLVEVAKEQSVFTFTDIEGSLVGFFTPAFMGSVNVPGFHLHFLSADRQQGGHLLECRPSRLRIGVQLISTLELALPLSFDYLTWDFHRDIQQDLEKAEK
jgi:acetolactate decarboxylase